MTELFGTTPTGEDVRRYTLTSPSGARLQLLDLGASASSYRLQAGDAGSEVLVGFDTLAQHLIGSASYFGDVVGRYANRIANGRFTLDGEEFVLDTNEGTTSLHGGPGGISKRVWRVTDQTEDVITFALTSPDGDQGFPGEVEIRATYRLLDDGFGLELAATTDRATPLCLTSHLFVNLAGGGSLDDHVLTVDADGYEPIDSASIPVSGPVLVEGTPFDLRQGARIGDRVREAHEQIELAKGIDHSFDLNGTGMRVVATLEHPGSGRRMELHADAPALQIYTGNFLDGTWASRNGRLRQGDAIALEPHVHPDSPNQSWADDVILRPSEEYRSRMEWHFSG